MDVLEMTLLHSGGLLLVGLTMTTAIRLFEMKLPEALGFLTGKRRRRGDAQEETPSPQPMPREQQPAAPRRAPEPIPDTGPMDIQATLVNYDDAPAAAQAGETAIFYVEQEITYLHSNEEIRL